MSIGLLTRRQLLGGACAAMAARNADAQPSSPGTDADHLRVGASDIEITFTGASFDLKKAELLAWVNQCATAVARYYGAFPVARARLMLVSREGRQGVAGGRTWGGREARTRITVGQHTS